MELWHVLNRGVEKRTIFLDDHDRFRFVHGLLLFNSSAPATNTTYLLESDYIDLRSRYRGQERIVDIHGWCLMDNHYHLLLSERVEGGITMFLRKLNIGYAKYFNDRYHRSGGLFQGRTKKKHIDNDAYFLHILNYIHLNPLDRTKKFSNWRTREIPNPDDAVKVLKQYRWSSYLDYCEQQNFDSLLTKNVFMDTFNSKGMLKDYSRVSLVDDTYCLE